MPAIPAIQARGILTQMIVDAYREMPVVMSFLRSFFPTEESFTRYVSIEVERNGESVAVDVERGTEGNRNSFSRSTEKIFEPPYFREYFDMTQIDLYDRLFGSPSIDSGVFSQLVQIVAMRIRQLRDKIERAYELQCAQVLQTGIVTVNTGDNINYGRKSASLVDLGAGNYWAAAGVDPYATLEAGCTFIRQAGKAQGGVFNAIMGAEAYRDFLKNSVVLARNDIKNWKLDDVRPPQRDSSGGVLHGQVSAGPYTINLWTCPEYYDNAQKVSTPYLDPKKVTILPEAPRFKMAFGAVPQLLKAGNNLNQDAMIAPPTRGAYVVGDYVDDRATAHIVDVKSAGLAIPVAVDQMYTLKAVAG